jgi:hypothetical protein
LEDSFIHSEQASTGQKQLTEGKPLIAQAFYSIVLNRQILSTLSSAGRPAIAMDEQLDPTKLSILERSSVKGNEVVMSPEAEGSRLLLLLTSALQLTPYMLNASDAVQLLCTIVANKLQLQHRLQVSLGGSSGLQFGSELVETSSTNALDLDPSVAVDMQVQQLYPCVLSRLSLHITNNVKNFNMVQLVRVLEKLSELERWRPGILLSSICQQLLVSVNRLGTPAHLQDEEHRRFIMMSMQSALLNLVRLKYYKGPAIAMAAWCLRHIREYNAKPGALASLVWACGRLKFRKDTLLKPVLQMLLGTRNKLPVRWAGDMHQVVSLF